MTTPIHNGADIDDSAPATRTSPEAESEQPAAEPARPETAEEASATTGGKGARMATTLAGAAGLIAVLTIVSRLVGFGRIFVVSWALGITSLGNIYQTINTLPNIIYEIVAGGALAAIVIPLLSSAIAKGDTGNVDRACSALLTWTVMVLAPLAVVIAIFARPLVSALLGSDAGDAEVDLGTRMLWVFTPQLVLYGVGIVFTGILQAHHKFAWPALAPLLSSLTVITAYVTFAVLAGPGADVAGLGRPSELVLSVGTTVAVAVLSLCLLIPLRKLGITVRPRLRFPDGMARQAASLLGGGLAVVAAQQLTLLVVLRLAQHPVGGTVTYGLAQTVFYVPWAVLAVPIATSAFPRLSAAHAREDKGEFAKTLSQSAQALVLLCAWASGAMIAASAGIAGVITGVAAGRNSTGELTGAFVAFAPGLIGFGLLALLSRALYAVGVSAATAVVTVAGWGVVIAADVLLVSVVAEADRVPALAAGHSIGMVLLGAALLMLCRRKLGADSLRGVYRTLLVGIAAGAVGAGGGYGVGLLFDGDSVAVALFAAAVAGVVASVGFVVVLAVVDRPRLRTVVSMATGRLGRFGKLSRFAQRRSATGAVRPSEKEKSDG